MSDKDYRTKVKTGLESAAKSFSAGISESMENLFDALNNAANIEELQTGLSKVQDRLENLGSLVKEQGASILASQQSINGLKGRVDDLGGDSSLKNFQMQIERKMQESERRFKDIKESTKQELEKMQAQNDLAAFRNEVSAWLQDIEKNLAHIEETRKKASVLFENLAQAAREKLPEKK